MQVLNVSSFLNCMHNTDVPEVFFNFLSRKSLKKKYRTGTTELCLYSGMKGDKKRGIIVNTATTFAAYWVVEDILLICSRSYTVTYERITVE
jgi:hypothetical protein